MSDINSSSRFPSSWAQCYALYAGELETILSSIVDDELDLHTAGREFVYAIERHHERTSLLAREGAQAAYDRLRRG